MAENTPTPPGGIPTFGGALPPKKETGKVQPKKETVRINLPPKPSAAPTIKLPTLPPGGPTGASSVSTPAFVPAPIAAPAAPAPRVGTAAPVAHRTATTAARPAAPVAVATLSKVDTILAIAAAVVGLAAVATTVWIMTMIK